MRSFKKKKKIKIFVLYNKNNNNNTIYLSDIFGIQYNKLNNSSRYKIDQQWPKYSDQQNILEYTYFIKGNWSKNYIKFWIIIFMSEHTNTVKYHKSIAPWNVSAINNNDKI